MMNDNACPETADTLTDVIITMAQDYDNGLLHYHRSVDFAIYAAAVNAEMLCVGPEEIREHFHILYELARRLVELDGLLRGK